MKVKELIQDLTEMPMELEVYFEANDNSLHNICHVDYNKVQEKVILE